ncbi:Imm26 family immunity protein [Pectobacterium sp. CHL-2024]|uniref:Imm26 family immunity protein n=1 Tax=Pectobacterium sp. CHL-2024 TaxID=3377079 RepID=UPI0038138E5E
MTVKYKEGDIFIVESRSGKFAVCQIVCAFRGDFKKVFSFGVLCIKEDKEVPDDGGFIPFNGSRGVFNIIFAASENIKKGNWKVVGNIPISEEKEKFKFYQSAGHLYKCDEYLRCLDKSEYRDFIIMGVAGNDLVMNYFDQY